jgi:hypothetical protein
MPNSIALFKQYIPLLDEVYKISSLTSVLDGASELVSQGANANELIVQKMSMDGLADYSRNGGYVAGSVTMTNETVKCNFDRGRMFSIDNMDNAETAGMAYGRLSAEFIRTKVIPELDAFRFAKYAGVEGISTVAGAVLSTGDAVVKALSAAYDKMTDDEVPESDRHLFITPTLYGLVRDLDTTKSKAILDKFASITRVPQSRFYTAIAQRDGSSSGEEAGGYTKAEGAVNINFMIIHKPAVIQYQKHVAPKVVTPEMNQEADAWKFGYRNVGIADAYENKVAGIYLHKSTT